MTQAAEALARSIPMCLTAEEKLRRKRALLEALRAALAARVTR